MWRLFPEQKQMPKDIHDMPNTLRTKEMFSPPVYYMQLPTSYFPLCVVSYSCSWRVNVEKEPMAKWICFEIQIAYDRLEKTQRLKIVTHSSTSNVQSRVSPQLTSSVCICEQPTAGWLRLLWLLPDGLLMLDEFTLRGRSQGCWEDKHFSDCNNTSVIWEVAHLKDKASFFVGKSTESGIPV